MPERARKQKNLRTLKEILALILRRFGEDQCLRIAASLSYICLLSLVPLMAISFAIFSAFPAFDGVQQQLQNYVFQNLVPTSGGVVAEYLDQFTQKTSSTTTVGIIGLGLTAVMLLATIEDALNRIFKVQNKRPLVSRLLMFWSLLTMGPLLMGASLSLSTYFYALTNWVDSAKIGGVSAFLSIVLPNVMIILALTFFYLFVPNRQISWKNALIGGAFAGVSFAILKKLFGLYVSHFPSYQAIYGVLAAIPIFLVWMYLTWSVVLMGALLTATLEDWGKVSFRKSRLLSSADKLVASLHILRILKEQHEKGGALHESQLSREIGVQNLAQLLPLLLKSSFVARTADEKLVLSRDLAHADLSHLYDALELGLLPSDSKTVDMPALLKEVEIKCKEVMADSI